jgi:hypothetical protein
VEEANTSASGHGRHELGKGTHALLPFFTQTTATRPS